MAPFTSILKSKKGKKQQRPSTPPSPGSFVSRSPKWAFDELLEQDPRSPGQLQQGRTPSRQQYEPEYFEVLDIAISPSQSSNNDYSPNNQRSASPGVVLPARPKPAPLAMPAQAWAQAPSISSSGFSTAPLSNTLSVVHTPQRDSVQSQDMRGSSSSDPQHQLMAFAFPLPPSGTPAMSNSPPTLKSFSVRDRELPILPPPTRGLKLNKYPSMDELKATGSSSAPRSHTPDWEAKTKGSERLKADHMRHVHRSRSATLPSLPQDDLPSSPSSPASSSTSPNPPRRETPRPIRIPTLRTTGTMATLLESVPETDLSSKPQPALPPPTPTSIRFADVLIKEGEGESSDTDLPSPGITQAARSRPPRLPHPPSIHRPRTAPESMSTPSRDVAISSLISSALARQSVSSTTVTSVSDSPVTTYSRFSTSFAPATPTQPVQNPPQGPSTPDPASLLSYLTPSFDSNLTNTTPKRNMTSNSRTSEMPLPFSPGFLGSTNRHASFLSNKLGLSGSNGSGGSGSGMRIDSPTLPMDFEPMQIAAMVLVELEKGREEMRHVEGTMTPASNVAVKGLDLVEPPSQGLRPWLALPSVSTARSSTSEIRSMEGRAANGDGSGHVVGEGHDPVDGDGRRNPSSGHRPPLLHLPSAIRSSTSEVRSAEGRIVSGTEAETEPPRDPNGSYTLQRPLLFHHSSSSAASSPSSPIPPSSASSQSKYSIHGSNTGNSNGNSNSRMPTRLDHSTSVKLASRKRYSVSAEQPTFFPRFDDDGDGNVLNGRGSVFTIDGRADSPFLGAAGNGGESHSGSTRSSWARQTGNDTTAIRKATPATSAHASPTSGTPVLAHSPSVSTLSSRGSSNRISTPLDVTDALIMGLALRGASTTGLGEVEEERDEDVSVQPNRGEPRHAYAIAMPVQQPAPPSRRPSQASSVPPLSPMPTIASSKTASDSTVTDAGRTPVRSTSVSDESMHSSDPAMLVKTDSADGVMVTNVAVRVKRNSFSKPPRRAPTPSGVRAFGSESVFGAESSSTPAVRSSSAVETIKGEAFRLGRLSPSSWAQTKFGRDRSASDAVLLPSSSGPTKIVIHRGRSDSESVIVPASTQIAPRNPTSPSDNHSIHRNKSESNLQTGKANDGEGLQPLLTNGPTEDKSSLRRKGALLALPTSVKIVPHAATTSPTSFPMTARPYSLTSSDNHHDHQTAQYLTFNAPETPVPALPVVSEQHVRTLKASASQSSSHRSDSSRSGARSLGTRKPRLGGSREKGLKFTGSPLIGQPPTRSGVSVPSFERVPIPWKGLTIDAAKWTLSSDQLQAIVSLAIRQSSEASTTRILSPDVLDTQIPEETQRLEALQVEIKMRYKFQIRKRKLLERSLALHIEGADTDKARKLTEDLVESTEACDRLSQELFQVADQLAQMTQLVQRHSSSALSMGLRKLNTSYVKAKGESIDQQLQLAMLEAERDEAWRLAETLERELNQLKDRAKRSTLIEEDVADSGLLSPTHFSAPILWASGPNSISASRSSRSSRVSSARANSIRASKTSLRLSLKMGSRISSASVKGLCNVSAPSGSRNSYGSITVSRPTSTQSNMTGYHFVIPPVPPLPSNNSRRGSNGSPIRPMSVSIAATPTTATSQSQARALAQIQNQLYEMLGIPSPNAQMSPFGATFDLGSRASSSSARPRSMSFPGSPNPWVEASNSSRRMSVQGSLRHHNSLLESPQVIATMLSSLPSE
ncbi:hypothetical protein FRB98_004102 [Tulasnella sp. 332]|nr:hypothetical protein FRB98_004102 [Tulasnella sp. 332]